MASTGGDMAYQEVTNYHAGADDASNHAVLFSPAEASIIVAVIVMPLAANMMRHAIFIARSQVAKRQRLANHQQSASPSENARNWPFTRC